MRLISDITVRLIDKMGGDHMAIGAARTSTSGEDALQWLEKPPEDNYGLINYLLKHRHGAPVEHNALCFFVHAPIFVFREWQRHRIASYSEMSARYRPLEPVFWIPRRNRPMVKVEKYKAARPQFITLDESFALDGLTKGEIKNLADEKYTKIISRMRSAYQKAWKAYQDNQKDEIGLEVCRTVLPVGVYSCMWATMNPRSLMNFLSLRVHDKSASTISYPQLEIEEAARQCELIFAEHWPLLYKAFVENGRVAP